MSFFARDIGIARELSERLGESLSVFFIERTEDELPVRDGDKVLRTPFLEARLIVILLRAGYGEGQWTGVERTAIAEACLGQGYRNLLVVRMEPMADAKWIAVPHLSLDLDSFPIEQLVGAIKMRAIELGARAQPMTVEKRAEIRLANEAYEAERKRVRTGPSGLQRFQQELLVLFGEVARKCTALADSNIGIEQNHSESRCVIRGRLASLAIFWRSGYGTVESQKLIVEEYKARMALPNERWIFIDARPSPADAGQYELDLSRTRSLVWTTTGAGGQYSSTVLADRLVVQFLDLADRVTTDTNLRARV
jgi:hypothetical protein